MWFDIQWLYDKYTDHDTSDIPSFKLADSQIQRLVHISIDPLSYESVQVDWPPQQQNMALLQQSFITICPRIGKIDPSGCTFTSESLIKNNTEKKKKRSQCRLTQ